MKGGLDSPAGVYSPIRRTVTSTIVGSWCLLWKGSTDRPHNAVSIDQTGSPGTR